MKITVKYLLYQGRHYANNEAGLTLLSEAMIDRAKTESRLGFFTIVFTDGMRLRRSVASLFTRQELGI